MLLPADACFVNTTADSSESTSNHAWQTGLNFDDSPRLEPRDSTSPKVEYVSTTYASPLDLEHPATLESAWEKDWRIRQDLISNAMRMSQVERLVVANHAKRTGIPEESLLHSLRYHWCWVDPMFPCGLQACLYEGDGCGRK